MGDSYIDGECRISCAERVSIGDGCAIAWNVEILDNNGGHTLHVDGDVRPTSSGIEIRDSVWIGNHVTIEQGATIGGGVVVASNSPVTEDLPPGTIVAGIPATVVRENVEWIR